METIKLNKKVTSIEVNDDKIVINLEKKWMPKDGEYIAIDNRGVLIGISNGEVRRGNSGVEIYVGICYDGSIVFNSSFGYQMDSILRPATPEEIQLLTNKLKERGKRWNAEKKLIEDIPTWKVGDWFIPHKPKEPKEPPYWAGYMDIFNNEKLKVESITREGYLCSNKFNFHPDWCEKTEAPKKEPQIGDMCIFWGASKQEAIISILKEYDGSSVPYRAISGFWYAYCIPFESIEQYKQFIQK